jgi:hypothetical protein
MSGACQEHHRVVNAWYLAVQGNIACQLESDAKVLVPCTT